MLRAVERPASIQEPFMAFEVSPDGSNASITIMSPTDSNHSETGDREARGADLEAGGGGS